MSREVKEWIASHDDQSIPPRVRVRTFDRYGGCCAICTRPIAGSLSPAYDHTIAIINGGQHRESNLQLLCVPCHQDKTGNDVAEKSRIYRKRANHIGIKKPRKITRWRNFRGEIVTVSRERT
jgi:5-methylcytosine-specific restriction endonuclease McrA